MARSVQADPFCPHYTLELVLRWRERVDPTDPELSRSIIQAYLPFSNPMARHMSDISLNPNVLITLELSSDTTVTRYESGGDVVTAPYPWA